MDKMKMQTSDIADENFRKLAALFPDAVTETINADGEVVRAIDKDKLMQDISTTVVDGNEERYQFTWPDKRKAIRLASSPIAATLRPCSKESVNFDTTENLYIEGDNLDVLKLLRETYLGKVKMIYIDPPYNTGNDFVYEDDFSESAEDYAGRSGDYDDQGNRMVQNTDSNGRFHTDWLNMIYPRLKIAKDLLSDDGVIFISIDDNEYINLGKICDEIYGASNCIGPLIQNKHNSKNDTKNIQKNHEFILVYKKGNIKSENNQAVLTRQKVTYKDIQEENGCYFYLNDPITTRGEGGTLNARPNLGYTVYFNSTTGDKIAVADYDIQLAKISNDEEAVYTTNTNLVNSGYEAIRPPKVRGKLGCWTWALDKFNEEKDSIYIAGKPNSYAVKKRTFVDKKSVIEINGKLQYEVVGFANSKSILDYSTNDGTDELTSVFNGESLFNNPKNLKMLEYFLSLIQESDYYILDFFSGSATTAHAVMQLNAEDGGNRKFIMVQLPEPCYEESEAFKAGYKNICEIGKERIRRAGKKILEEHLQTTRKEDTLFSQSAESAKSADKLDVGFRVLKLDSTNMEDVYYNPAETKQDDLLGRISNIKFDRTPEDLLFQVMLELGILPSSKIEKSTIAGKQVFNVADNFLIACFDENITDGVVTAIAKQKPQYVVLRDSGFASDSVAANFEQIFATYSPDTTRRIL